jgi:uncharacterized protein YbjT (DUF2867 family)
MTPDHVVLLSAAGAGRAPTRYHRAMARREAAVRASGLPFSIVRAAPTHGELDTFLTRWAERGILPLMPVPLQPVDDREIAAHLTAVVEAGPSGIAAPFVGPRVERLDRLALLWAAARGCDAVPVEVAVAPELRDGALLHPEAWAGRITFEAWLTPEMAVAA